MKIKDTDSFIQIQKIKDLSKNDSILNKNEKKELLNKSTELKLQQDTVLISEDAKEKLNEYNKNYFNESKVNDIKERLMNGSYKIDTDSIAKKIIAFEF